MTRELSIKHSNYMMTIGEVIEAIESLALGKVVKIDPKGDVLTFTLEEPKEKGLKDYCSVCYHELETERDKKLGLCEACYPY
jgi:hypothetical protein